LNALESVSQPEWHAQHNN